MVTGAPENKVTISTKITQVTSSLLSPDRRIRNHAITHFKRLLLKHSGNTNDAFQLADYLYVWNGLFYFMWSSDTPLKQKSALEKISNLIHSCTSYEGKILFMNSYFVTIRNGRFMSHKTDQFMMLLRRFLRQSIFTCINYDWNLEYVDKFFVVIYNAFKLSTHSVRTPLQNMYVEELVKACSGNVPIQALLIIIDAI